MLILLILRQIQFSNVSKISRLIKFVLSISLTDSLDSDQSQNDNVYPFLGTNSKSTLKAVYKNVLKSKKWVFTIYHSGNFLILLFTILSQN